VWSRGATLAAVACAATLGVALVAAERAIRLDPLPRAVTPPRPMPSSQVSVRTATGRDVVRLAVEHDPFRPERRPPPARFRMPGEGPAGGADSAALGPELAMRLIGTAVTAPGRGFAMCQAGEAAPRLVRVGESFAGFTLRSVERGRALFRAPDGRTLDLRVPKVDS
jgi:hypothetical protein